MGYIRCRGLFGIRWFQVMCSVGSKGCDDRIKRLISQKQGGFVLQLSPAMVRKELQTVRLRSMMLKSWNHYVYVLMKLEKLESILNGVASLRHSVGYESDCGLKPVLFQPALSGHLQAHVLGQEPPGSSIMAVQRHLPGLWRRPLCPYKASTRRNSCRCHLLIGIYASTRYSVGKANYMGGVVQDI